MASVLPRNRYAAAAPAFPSLRGRRKPVRESVGGGRLRGRIFQIWVQRIAAQREEPARNIPRESSLNGTQVLSCGVQTLRAYHPSIEEENARAPRRSGSQPALSSAQMIGPFAGYSPQVWTCRTCVAKRCLKASSPRPKSKTLAPSAAAASSNWRSKTSPGEWRARSIAKVGLYQK